MTNEHLTTLRDIESIFKSAIAELEADLAAPVLDGTPFALYIDAEDGAGSFKLLYGTPYEGQPAHAEGARYAFRFQRGFDLCGCLLMSDEGSKRNLGRTLKRKDGSVATVKRIHRRDHMREELDGLKSSLEHVRNAISKLPTT